MTCIESGFNFFNSISNLCSIILWTNVLIKWSIRKNLPKFLSLGSSLSFITIDSISIKKKYPTFIQ